MTIESLSAAVEGRIVSGGTAEVNGVYVGDFLSRVMGKAPSGCAWLTVMNNVNVAGVAVLAEIGAVVLCEGVEPSPELAEKCSAEKIPLIATKLTAYEACLRLGTGS